MLAQRADLHLSTTGRECRDVVFPAQRLACEADAASLRFLEEILDSEKPDFVAFTGDQVDGSHAPNTKSVKPVLNIGNNIGHVQVCLNMYRSEHTLCSNIWQS